ncbi:hypothetical protein K7432_011871 [Basidiobolus ranarum]|uniref:O-fucosyltransferase family protein n=1 Tax=Basidiobolus ranarum TaxID=34480 RepID=A0ABR2VTN9_9FUNG
MQLMIKPTISCWKERLENKLFPIQWSSLESQDKQLVESRRYPRLKPKVFFCCFLGILVCILGWFYFSRTPENPEYQVQKSWFTSEEVQQFRKSYPPLEYSLETRSLTYMLHGCVSGFGSFVNNAFNLFLIALDNKMSFHLQSLDWCYISWSTFFEDWTSNSATPINLDRYNVTAQRWHPAEGTFAAINSTSFKGHLFVEHWGENFNEFYYHQVEKIEGPVFERKQLVAQALWEPKPLITDLTKGVRRHYVEEANKVMISMHIRRGDKLANEMQDLSVSLYSDKVIDLSTNKYPGRNIALFVFSDDDKSVTELRGLLADYFNIEIFLLSDAISHTPSLAKNWKPLTQRQGYDQGDFSRANEEYRFRQTAELITDITLAATADEFICTYSSNIGRLVTLLRTKPLTTVHSLDIEEWRNN